MSCAQVMYQPYAPSPYVVQPDTPQTAPPPPPPHGSGSATAAAAVVAAAAASESRHSEGGGGGGGPVLHHPQPTTSAIITPHTPPHAHHHHHQQQQQQPTQQPLPQAQIQRTSEAGSNNAQVQQQQQQQTPQATQQQQQQTQGQQQQQQQPQASTSSDGSGGAQRSLTRPPYRAASNGSAAADPDAPPPEKKFCSDSEAPATPATPSSSSLPHGHHPHHHQASHHQHQHHHHHHHHSHHHPPHTEPPGSPSQHTTQQQQQEVKYVSANCMVVTHYAGDTSAVVDEHFTRALSTPHYEKPHSPGKAASPMSSRNFPPSFWNSNYQIPATSSSSRPPSLAGHLAGASPADLYDPYHGGLHSLQPPAPDPWAAYSLSSQAYGHRSVAHDVYQAAMSSVPSSSRPYHQYSSLSFQPHLARLPGVTPVASQMPMAKPESWGARYHEAFSNPELAHGLETNYPAAHYPNVPGLETGVPQEGAKDLYWF